MRPQRSRNSANGFDRQIAARGMQRNKVIDTMWTGHRQDFPPRNLPWPDFYIVGAPKAGTSSLHVYLSQVPGICMSRIKEPNYFAPVVVPDGSRLRPIRDTSSYLDLFSHARAGDLKGEASPTYLEDPNAARLIHGVLPNARIIITLRDPVDLAYSFYLMLLRNDGAGTFLDEIKRKLRTDSVDWRRIELRLEYGFFYEGIKRYLDTFGEAQVKIVLHEDLARQTAATVDDLLSFLGVEFDGSKLDLRRYNVYGSPRGPWAKTVLGNRRILHMAERMTPARFRSWVKRTFLLKPAPKPRMDPEAESLLIDLYRSDVVRTCDLLQIEPPWPRFKQDSNKKHSCAV